MAKKNPSSSATGTEPRLGNGEKLKAETLKSAIYSPADVMLEKDELAAKLKVHVRSIENWQRDGFLPYIKIGNAVWFYWPDVIQHLLTHFRCLRCEPVAAPLTNTAVAARHALPTKGGAQ